MKLKLLPNEYSVCRLEHDDAQPDWLAGEVTCVFRSSSELTVVCESKKVPSAIKQESNWRCFQFEGTLDFALTGIIARVSKCLADAGISIFVMSTFDTDYFLVRQENLGLTVERLRSSGYELSTD